MPVLVALAALSLSATPASAQPQAGRFFLRGSLGIASQSLSDWNDDIKADEQVLQSIGLPVSFDTFGPAVPFGFEAGYQANELIAISLSVTHQSGRVRNHYGDFSGSLAIDEDVALTALTGGLSYSVPGARGLFLGADAGVGFGSATNDLAYRDFIDPANDVMISADWSGNGFVAGVFGGYQLEYPSGLELFGKLGYQFQNLGTFDGTATEAGFGTWSGPPSDNAGQPIDTVFSGVQLILGIGVALGSR